MTMLPSPRAILATLCLAALACLTAAPHAATEESSNQAGRSPQLEGLLKQVMERGMANALGVPVSIREVEAGRNAERMTLRQLRIGNPSGFDGEHALTAESIVIEGALLGLLGDGPRLDLVHIDGLKVFAETQLTRGVNLLKLRDNVREFSRRPAGRLLQQRETRVYIEEGVISGGEAHIATGVPGSEPRRQELERIEMSFTGPNGQGVAPEEAVAQLVRRILRDIELVEPDSPLAPLNELMDLL